MKYRFIYLVLILFPAMIGSAHKKDSPEFRLHVIDSIGNHMGQTALADMDQDGDLDWVVGEAPWGQTSRLWYWEFQAADNWIRHEMGKANSDVGGDCHDVNGDGWPDFWGGTLLFLNGQDGTFIPYKVGTTFSHDSQFADVDGDGRMDGIANWDQYGLIWYSIPEDPTEPWTGHMIRPAEDHKIHGGASPHPTGDLDGDGDIDIVSGQAWYENLDGKGMQWQEHPDLAFGEKHKYGIALKSWVADMDADGDMDIVQSEADNPDGRVAWFKNDGKGDLSMHLIKNHGDGQDFHSLVVADFDGDGDLDVCSGGGPLSTQPMQLYIWEQVQGRAWIEHVIAQIPCHETVGGDVDGDGDVDLCTKPWSTGNVHYFIENLHISKQKRKRRKPRED